MARVFHNGSIFRDSVPLWSYVFLSPRLHGVPRRFYGQAGFHNGSVFRDSVPVWQRTKDVDGSGSTSQRGCHGSCLPQRQRFPRFGAGVVVRFPVTPSSRCSKAVLRSGRFPQRQCFPRFCVVVVVRFPVTPSSRYSKAASRSVRIPQRQRFP